MRQPLMLLQFDIESENTTVRILRSMSRIRGVEKLSPASSFRVLTNDALRSRIELTTTESQMLELVESAISDELVLLQGRVTELEEAMDSTATDETKARLQSAEEEANQMRVLATTAASEAESTKARVAELEAYVEKINLAEESDRLALEAERDSLRDRVENLERAQRSSTDRSQKRRFAINALFLILLAGVSASLLPVVLDGVWQLWVRILLGVVSAVIFLALALEQFMRHFQAYEEKRLYKVVRNLRKWLVTGLIAITFSVVAGLIVNSISTRH
jgi:hypothetical protein